MTTLLIDVVNLVFAHLISFVMFVLKKLKIQLPRIKRVPPGLSLPPKNPFFILKFLNFGGGGGGGPFICS